MGNIDGKSFYYGDTRKRDVSGGFAALVAKKPFLISLIGMGAPATNNKVEWQEDQFVPTQTTIASFPTGSTGADATVINVADATGIEVGTVLRFASKLDATRTEQVIVTDVTGNALTVTRKYGDTTASTFAVDDKVFRSSKPLAEGTDAGAGNGRVPVWKFNYTQIFDAVAQVSRTSNQVSMYDINAMDYAVENKMNEISYDINNAFIYGRKVERDASNKGSLGGILQFLEGGNIDTTGGAISATILNNMVEAVLQDGASTEGLAIVCNTNQARKISAFDNSLLSIQRGDMTSGKAIGTFQSDLVAGGAHTIVVDHTFPKDQIALLNLGLIKMRPMKTMTAENAALPGADYLKQRLLTELTLEVKNGTTAHALATGLTV